jgi:hypothetical protein
MAKSPLLGEPWINKVLLPVWWYFTATYFDSIFVMLQSKAWTDVMQRQHFSPAAALQIQKLHVVIE